MEHQARSQRADMPLSAFSLLADPANYVVSDVDLLSDAGAREYWLKLFSEHFQHVLEAARQAYGRQFARQAQRAGQQFAATIESLRSSPQPIDGRLGVVELCRLREKALRDYGLKDPFRHVKLRENRVAAGLYGEAVASIAALPLEQRWDRLVRGVFAGNIFDLGSAATMGYARERVDFEQVIAQIRPRPWRIDDFDELSALLPTSGGEPAPWAKAIVFVDNAGADFILGVMPLARQLAGHGTHVVLAANELPSLNDITVDETIEIVQQLAAEDEELATYVSAELFEVVSTGNDIPLIDLAQVSQELNEAAADADLVVLEGMGRSVESNLQTRFTVDSIQLCLLKDPAVAARVGGEVFDCVCMYRPAEQQEQAHAEG